MESMPPFPYRDVPIISTQRLQEHLTNPENEAEIIRYFEFIQEIEALVPADMTAREQETLRRDIHRSLRQAALPPPTTSAPPTRTVLSPATTIPIGEHMDITVGFTAHACWPDTQKQELTLTDGQVMTTATPIGIIDYYRNMQKLREGGSLIGFTRTLVSSAEESLKILAARYKEMGERAKVIEAFSGMSHLARLAPRFGFTVFDIPASDHQQAATQTSFRIASRVVGGNAAWQQFREKYKPAQIAMISSTGLIRKYG